LKYKYILLSSTTLFFKLLSMLQAIGHWIHLVVTKNIYFLIVHIFTQISIFFAQVFSVCISFVFNISTLHIFISCAFKSQIFFFLFNHSSVSNRFQHISSVFFSSILGTNRLNSANVRKVIFVPVLHDLLIMLPGEPVNIGISLNLHHVCSCTLLYAYYVNCRTAWLHPTITFFQSWGHCRMVYIHHCICGHFVVLL